MAFDTVRPAGEGSLPMRSFRAPVAFAVVLAACSKSAAGDSDTDVACLQPRCDNPNPNSCACPDDTDGIVTNSATDPTQPDPDTTFTTTDAESTTTTGAETTTTGIEPVTTGETSASSTTGESSSSDTTTETGTSTGTDTGTSTGTDTETSESSTSGN